MTAHGPDGRRSVRRRQVDCGRGIRASLAYYAPGTSQPRHVHDFSQISFLLAGSMAERLEGRDHELDHPALGVKPAGAVHEDRWGGDGVLIFSLHLGVAGLGAPRCDAPPAWSRLPDSLAAGSLASACLSARDMRLRGEAVDDLLDMVGGGAEPACRRSAPAWLNRARRAIIEAPDEVTVEAAARAARVDRAHFSRMFRRSFGMPPSLFRQRRLAARAAAAIVGSADPISQVAFDSGYCDQAHLNRRLKAQTGFSPGELRRLLGARDHISPIPA